MKKQHYKFELIDLPYDYSALEPYIDTLTMQLHHNRHLKTYVDNLNKVLENYEEYQNWSLERLIKNACFLPDEIKTLVKRNAGGVYNHEFFFKNMAPHDSRGVLSSELETKITTTFGSFEDFKDKFKKEALDVFGSGYAFLVKNKDCDLKIIKTANQDTPLTCDMIPIMCIDVWEHAYYLKHYNKRDAYINDWFSVVNLTEASKNYKEE